MRKLIVPLVFLLALCAASANADDKIPLTVTLKGGASLYLNGQSNAVPHRIKPGARIELVYHLYNELDVGIELAANWDKNKNYRLIGGYLIAQVPLYSGSFFNLGIRTGWGAGTGPRILFVDLINEETLTLWVQAGIQMRMIVAGFMSVTIDIISENMSVVTANCGLGFHF